MSKSRTLISTLGIFLVGIGLFYEIGTPAGASAGLMMGLEGPLTSPVMLILLAAMGFYSSTRKTPDLYLFPVSFVIAMIMSISINLLPNHAVIFRSLILISICSFVFLSQMVTGNKFIFYAFGFAGYLSGMNKGVNLPEIACAFYYTVGVTISSLLMASAFILLGVAVGGETTEYLRERTLKYCQHPLILSIKRILF